ncbi:MAG: transcription termination/antitermination factor NusG [Ruminococcaceae bacterium]|nr:transcription termination/antitermination factor NusG [Oscillospiraceae bacterium]
MSDFNELNVGPRWYIIHTYTGYENKVKATIERVITNRNLSDLIFDVKIPVTTTVVTNAKGEEKTVEEKIHPSYVFIKMVMNDETWHAVRNIGGVTGFVGPGSRPVPLTDKEVLDLQVEEQIKHAFEIGDEVEIIDGFLTGHKGTISEMSEDASEVTVIVSTIGREMPVSLDAKAIKKI